MPYPVRSNEAERLRQLRELAIIGTAPSDVLEQICVFAQELLAVPIVAVTLLDEDSQWLHSKSGTTLERTPRDHAFCNYTLLGDDVMVVADAKNDIRFANNPAVTGEGGIRFYAGVPLAIEPGVPVATFCCLDTKPRRFSERHKKILADLGALALSQLKLHRVNLALELASKTDALTGLANRNALSEQIERAIADARGANKKVALLFIDLDRFKEINDTLGHGAGDALLQAVATTIRTNLPNWAMPVRIGGDEFAVLLTSISTAKEAVRIAEDLLKALRTDISVGAKNVSCHASMGIALFPDHASDAGHLLKASDLALYAAKDAGRDRFAVFQVEMQNRIQVRFDKLARARDVLTKKQILPFYQPKVALDSGRVVGFEALLRIKTQDGIALPADIDEAFNDPSLAHEIGMVMLDRIIQDMMSWSHDSVPFGSVALNITEWDMSSELPQRVLSSLSKANLPSSALQVEVTESVFLNRNTKSTKTVLKTLRSAGVQVSLDDFGTGFASLTHLRDFPVDWLKLDRSFVSRIDSEQEAASIAHGIISLAASLHIGVVAEGVETHAQLEFLKLRHCDIAQGYLVSAPLSASEVPHFLQTWNGVTFSDGSKTDRPLHAKALT